MGRMSFEGNLVKMDRRLIQNHAHFPKKAFSKIYPRGIKNVVHRNPRIIFPPLQLEKSRLQVMKNVLNGEAELFKNAHGNKNKESV